MLTIIARTMVPSPAIRITPLLAIIMPIIRIMVPATTKLIIIAMTTPKKATVPAKDTTLIMITWNLYATGSGYA